MVKIQSIVSEKFFEGRVYGRTHGRTDGQMHDGHKAMTIACWTSASGAKNQFLSQNYFVFACALILLNMVKCNILSFGKELLDLKYMYSNTCTNSYCSKQPFPKQALVFRCLQHKSFENTVGKGGMAPFPTVLSNH